MGNLSQLKYFEELFIQPNFKIDSMKLMELASAEKLRGGFYTPEPIAEFILRWGINGSTKFDILEPSCGDGVFLEQILHI